MQAAPKGITLWGVIKVVLVLGIAWVFLEVVNASYADYIPRSQMSEAVSLLGSAKKPVAEFYSAKGKWPAAGDKVLTETSGKYTDRLEIAAGTGAQAGTVTITATMRNTGLNSALKSKTVQMSSQDGKTWICRPGSLNGVEPKYLPAACRP